MYVSHTNMNQNYIRDGKIARKNDVMKDVVIKKLANNYLFVKFNMLVNAETEDKFRKYFFTANVLTIKKRTFFSSKITNFESLHYKCEIVTNLVFIPA